MILSLWTAASGMNAQQMNVDVISNNLANVNTTGYKEQKAEFKDLLYDKLNGPANVPGSKPVDIEVGAGVAPSAVVRSFDEGNLNETGDKLDFAVAGNAFFVVRDNAGVNRYTRDGGFKVSAEGGNSYLVTSDGNYVMDSNGNRIALNNTDDLSVSQTGEIGIKDASGRITDTGVRIGLVQFTNPAGLESLGDNLFAATAASGAPSNTNMYANNQIKQGFLETSNINAVDQMVSLISAQRAYEINSKAVQASDDMLNTANNLRR